MSSEVDDSDVSEETHRFSDKSSDESVLSSDSSDGPDLDD